MFCPKCRGASWMIGIEKDGSKTYQCMKCKHEFTEKKGDTDATE